ncbi:MAG: glycosyltransferase family 39 protein [Acidobacteriota bacterium]
MAPLGIRPAARWPLVVVPAAKLLFHLVLFAGYGIFRDELYYMACAERLAFGYVDHPPLSIAALWLVRLVAGDSLFAMRAVPALLGAATVLATGLLVRKMGGRTFAQILAMLAVGWAPVLLSLQHFYSMNAFDLLFWSLAALTWAYRDDLGARHTWLLLGLLLGLGLQNKISVLWLGAGLLAGVVATPRRRDLATRWPWIGGLLAAVLFAPHLIWQVAHDWPTLEFIDNATGHKMVSRSLFEFFRSQIDMMNPLTAPLWLGGLLWLFFAHRGQSFRSLGWAYLVVFALLAASGTSRPNYLAPAYGWLFAAGATGFEGLTQARWARWTLRPAVAALLLVGAAAIAPLAIPILPVDSYIEWAKTLGAEPSTSERKELGALPQFYADMHGWDEIAATAATVYDSLPADERARTVIAAPDYGVAGAIERLGRQRELAPVACAHNSYWLWGLETLAEFDPTELTVIQIGGEFDDLAAVFGQVERVAHTDCGYCMPYEDGRPVYLARRLQVPVETVWQASKHFD